MINDLTWSKEMSVYFNIYSCKQTSSIHYLMDIRI